MTDDDAALMAEIKPVLDAVFSYVKAHPEELLRALRNALALRFGVPIVALRWLAGRVKGKKAPKDVDIEAVPLPHLHLALERQVVAYFAIATLTAKSTE